MMIYYLGPQVEYIAGNTPASSIISNLPFLIKPNPPKFVSGKGGKVAQVLLGVDGGGGGGERHTNAYDLGECALESHGPLHETDETWALLDRSASVTDWLGCARAILGWVGVRTWGGPPTTNIKTVMVRVPGATIQAPTVEVSGQGYPTSLGTQQLGQLTRRAVQWVPKLRSPGVLLCGHGRHESPPARLHHHPREGA